ncbi:MAG: T9SS type A sorting domain-containing protein [Bacteroidota bacterium]
MKKLPVLAALPLLALVLLGEMRLPVKRKGPAEPRPQQRSDDWFISQRIYPQGSINYEAYAEALQSAMSLRAESRSASAASWQFAGPTNIGGRVTDIEMHASDQQTIYLGAASGGVFKSTDQGLTWNPIFDQNASLSIGDIAIAPSNPNIIYVGTGECNNGRGSVTYDGQGVYKSTDAGQTWTSLGLQLTRNTGRIAIDPANPNKVFVATMGDLFSNGPNRGLYRTLDGGLTWTNVLSVNDSTGAVEVVIDPSNPNIVYASTWTRIRRPTYYLYGGTGSAIYKSTDGGSTWNMLTSGLPASSPNIGRIGIDISASNPNVLYAVYASEYGGFLGCYKTTNGGASWSAVTGNNYLLGSLSANAFYWFGRVKVDPTDPNTVFITDLSLWKSSDGGANWYDVGTSFHVDQHITYVHPANPSLVVEGNDGGVFISNDGGSSWTSAQDIPITQFYTCEVDNQNPSNLYGGTQDNGTNYTPTGGVNDWQFLFGGDGFYVLVNPVNPSYQIYEYQYGNLSTSMSGINTSENSNWNTPLIYNPQNPSTVFYGNVRVYKSYAHGNGGWFSISPNLTAGTQTGNLVFHTITTLSCSNADTNVIWAGCDDGNVQVTTNSGATWTNVSAGLPDRWITRVVADPLVAGRAYVTVSGFRWDEPYPHVFMTNNYGATWTAISSNLPQAPCNDLIVDPNSTSTLFVATDMGVYYTTDQGGNWQAAGTGMPLVPVTDMVLHNGTRTLIAATYGRSMWKMDIDQLLGSGDPAALNSGITISPNPVADHFVVRGAEGASLTLYNLEGKAVMTTKIDQAGKKIERSGLPAGVYLYLLSRPDGKKASGKLVLL